MLATTGDGHFTKKVDYEDASGKKHRIRIFDAISRMLAELNEKALSPLRMILPEIANYDLTFNDSRVSRNFNELRNVIDRIIEETKTKFTTEELRN
jgi:hypothetical protein